MYAYRLLVPESQPRNFLRGREKGSLLLAPEGQRRKKAFKRDKIARRHTHTHTHTQRERENEGRGRAGHVVGGGASARGGGRGLKEEE